MSYILIPTDGPSQTATSNLFWTQTTTLDGVPYQLTFKYNTRESAYYLTIASSDGSTVYAQGIKLVSNFPLLRNFSTPPGELYALATSNTDDSPARLGDLATRGRVALYYAEADTCYTTVGFEVYRNPGPFVNGVYAGPTS